MGNPSAESTVDVIEASTGTKRGYRRAHGRGIVCHAVFRARPEARELTIAEHFQGAEIPALVRLSNALASPFAPDRASNTAGQILGLAVRFQLANGKAATWAGVNLPSFIARTPEDFVRITKALKPSLFGRPNPLKILAHLIACPSAFAAFKSVATTPPTPSFAHVAFNGINTYFLVDAKGERRPFRYRWVPRAGTASLGPKAAATLPPQYLLEEIRTRLAAGPVDWDLSLQFPEPADALDDASRAWPASRRATVVGTLTATKVEPDQASTELLVFDPTNVVPGLALSDDPLLRFRADAYSESYRRRSQEKRDEPAPADMGQ